MATWTVPGTVLAIGGEGEALRLRVELAPGVTSEVQVRLALPDAPHEPLRARHGARLFVEHRVPAGSRVWFVSDRRDRDGRPMGRLLFGAGRRQDLAAALLYAGLALPPVPVVPGCPGRAPGR